MSHSSMHLPRNTSERKNTFALLVLAVVTICIGTWGYLILPEEHPGSMCLCVFDAFYHALQMLVLHTPHSEEHNWQLTLGMWLGAVFFGLAIVKPLGAFLWKEVHKRSVLARGGHVVVCGRSDFALAIAKTYAKSGNERAVIIVHNSTDEEWNHHCESAGAQVVVDDPLKESVLKRLALHTAERVIIVGDSDGQNVETALSVQRYLNKHVLCIPCFVRLENMDLRAILQRSGLLYDANEICPITFFDDFDAEALTLLQETMPVDRGLIKADGTGANLTPHLVILGFGRMGRSLAVRAAQLCHFANGKKLRISVIGNHTDARHKELLFRHPSFETVVDAAFITQPLISSETSNYIKAWCLEKDHLVTVAACFDNDALSVELALQLRPVLEYTKTPIALRMGKHRVLREILAEEAKGRNAGSAVYTFGLHEDKQIQRLLEDAPDDRLARALHEHYLQSVLPSNKPLPENPPRNFWPWERLDEDFKDSNRQQANHISVKLRAVGCERAPEDDERPAVTEFDANQLHVLSMMEHERWMAERLLAGWKYAPRGFANKALKQNHTLVAWDKLTTEEQGYDTAFVKGLPALLAVIQEKIVKCRA